MSIARLIERYGKEFIKKLIDIVVICDRKNRKNINEKTREILIEHNIIKKTTKIINTTIIITYDKSYHIFIRNGRNQNIIEEITFQQEKLPEIMELLNSDN